MCCSTLILNRSLSCCSCIWLRSPTSFTAGRRPIASSSSPSVVKCQDTKISRLRRSPFVYESHPFYSSRTSCNPSIPFFHFSPQIHIGITTCPHSEWHHLLHVSPILVIMIQCIVDLIPMPVAHWDVCQSIDPVYLLVIAFFWSSCFSLGTWPLQYRFQTLIKFWKYSSNHDRDLYV